MNVITKKRKNMKEKTLKHMKVDLCNYKKNLMNKSH